MNISVALAFFFLVGLCESRDSNSHFTVLAVYPHSTSDYTEGLFMEDADTVVESTGMYGESKLKRYRLSTGEVLKQVDLPKAYFGEGAVAINNVIFQMTYRERIVRKYDQASFDLLEELPMPKEIREGWGMTTDGHVIFATDGSNNVYVIDPTNFSVIRTMPIIDTEGRRVMSLNELEFIKGEIWANIYFSREIVRLDAATGAVRSYVDFMGLSSPDEKYNWGLGEVLNGIAYDGERVLLTGKYWKHIYAVSVD